MDIVVVDVVVESPVEPVLVVVVVVVVVVDVVVLVVVGFKTGPVGGGAVAGRTRDGPLVLVGAGAGVVAVVAGPAVASPRPPAVAVGADSSPLSAAAGSLRFGAPWVTTWWAAG